MKAYITARGWGSAGHSRSQDRGHPCPARLSLRSPSPCVRVPDVQRSREGIRCVLWWFSGSLNSLWEPWSASRLLSRPVFFLSVLAQEAWSFCTSWGGRLKRTWKEAALEGLAPESQNLEWCCLLGWALAGPGCPGLDTVGKGEQVYPLTHSKSQAGARSLL